MTPEPAPLAPDEIQTGILRLTELADLRQLQGEERYTRLILLRSQLAHIDRLLAEQEWDYRHPRKETN